jgi:pilus assembly protein CpaB
MKPARIIVLVVAIAAGGLAALLAGRSDPEVQPVAAVAPVVQIEMVDVLVAATDIGLGTGIAPRDLRWQQWPAAAASPQFIRKGDRADAIEQLSGSITRQAFAAGEPIREARLIKAQGSGYMAAILPQGLRAMAVEVSPESGAGGFILPNDHVDVIVARRDRDAEKLTGVEVHTSTTLLTNVRVLAIDQTVEEKQGQRVVVGRTATLELTPSQAETLARAKLMGQLVLALRSIIDFESKEVTVDEPHDDRRGINMVRFGITTITNVK